VARGGGTDSRIAVLPDDRAAIAYVIQPYDLQGGGNGSPGVWVNTEQALNGTTWTVTQVAPSSAIGGGPGFAINTHGRMSLAYFDGDSGKLWYTESTDDGVTWSDAEKVDTVGTAGQFPSLAIDPSGEPAIAYYRCSSKIEATQCDANLDGLRVARR